MKVSLEDVKFDGSGLVPVIVQDAQTRQVLMLAYMNAESLRRTLEDGETWFWSRSRSELWHKGATSGNTQRVIDLRLDCDSDALIALVNPRGGVACHTGAPSCFFNEVAVASDEISSPVSVEANAGQSGANDASDVDDDAGAEETVGLGALLAELYELIEMRRRERPEGSYTTYLFNAGLDKILKKVGEESAETIIAAKNQDPHALTAEAADLIYHLLVLLVERGVSLDAVRDELARRSAKKGTA